MRNLLIIAVCLGLMALSANVEARIAGDDLNAAPGIDSGFDVPRMQATQGGGMTLSEAIDSVRRGGNVERVISAETRVSGGREVHHIKVLTKDGKVKTHKVQGQKRG